MRTKTRTKRTRKNQRAERATTVPFTNRYPPQAHLGRDKHPCGDPCAGTAHPLYTAPPCHARNLLLLYYRGYRPGTYSPYNGMFPCFFGGFLSRFPSSISSAAHNRRRVSRGRITASTYPRSAAI